MDLIDLEQFKRTRDRKPQDEERRGIIWNITILAR